MNFLMPDFVPAVPEIFVLAAACAILIIDLFLKDSQRNLTYWLTQLTLAGALLLTLTGYEPDGRLTFAGTFINDAMSALLKSFVYVVTSATFVYSRPYLKARELFKGEYFVLGLFGVLGTMVMISAY